MISKETRKFAKRLSVITGSEVGVGEDMSITLGNVTANEYLVRTTTPSDVALVALAYANGSEFQTVPPSHVYLGSSPVQESGWQGCNEHTQEIAERPKDFAYSVKPPKGIVKMARHVILGNHLRYPL